MEKCVKEVFTLQLNDKVEYKLKVKGNQFAIVCCDFVFVNDFKIEFNHFDTSPPICEWNLDGTSLGVILRDENSLLFQIYNTKGALTLETEFELVQNVAAFQWIAKDKIAAIGLNGTIAIGRVLDNYIKCTDELENEYHDGAEHFVFENGLLYVGGGVKGEMEKSLVTIWKVDEVELQHSLSVHGGMVKGEKKKMHWVSYYYYVFVYFVVGWFMCLSYCRNMADSIQLRLMSTRNYGNIDKLIVSNGGKWFALLSKNGAVSIRDTNSGKEIVAWYSPDGEKIVDIGFLEDDEIVLVNDAGKLYYMKEEDGEFLKLEITTQLNTVPRLESNRNSVFGMRWEMESLVVFQLVNVSIEQVYRNTLEKREYNVALKMVESHSNLDKNVVYKHAWEHEAKTMKNIQMYLQHVQDSEWVLEQCCHQVLDEPTQMKALLQHGLHILNAEDTLEPDVSAKYRNLLLRYTDRLDTMLCLLQSEVSDDKTLDRDLYLPQVYQKMKNIDLRLIAIELATGGRIKPLRTLFNKCGYNVLPYRLEILECIPTTMDPNEYADLLPALPKHADGYYIVQRGSIVKAELTSLNRLYDTNDTMLQCFETQIKNTNDENLLMDWYAKRLFIVEQSCGMLSNCSTLCELALERLPEAHAGQQVTTKLQVLLSEIRMLRLATECQIQTMPEKSNLNIVHLVDWLSMPPHDKLKLIIDACDANTVAKVLYQFFLIVDINETEWLTALSQILIQLAGKSPSAEPDGLRICESVIAASNPLRPIEDRIIKGGVRLLEIAVGCIYACPETTDDAIERLWNIFQCLPERDPQEENRNKRFAQLQVQVDTLEGHLGAAELLTKYNVNIAMSVFHEATQESQIVGIEDRFSISKKLLQNACEFFAHDGTRTKPEWQKLLSDLLAITDHAFSWIDRDTVMEIVVREMVCSAAFTIAQPALFGRKAFFRSSKSQSIVIEFVREYVNGASDANHIDLDLARGCLFMMPIEKRKKSPAIQCEELLLQLCDLLVCLNVVSVPPLQIRMLTHKMDFVDKVLELSPMSYKSFQRCSDLSDYVERYSLEVNTSVIVHAAELMQMSTPSDKIQVKLRAAKGSMRFGDFQSCAILLHHMYDDIVRLEEDKGFSDAVLTILQMTVDVVSCRSFYDLQIRLDLCTSALCIGRWMNRPQSEILEHLSKWWSLLHAMVACCKHLTLNPSNLSVPTSFKAPPGQEAELYIQGQCAEAVQHLMRNSDGVENCNTLLLQTLQYGYYLNNAISNSNGQTLTAESCNFEELLQACIGALYKSVEVTRITQFFVAYMLSAYPLFEISEKLDQKLLESEQLGKDSCKNEIVNGAQHIFIIAALATKSWKQNYDGGFAARFIQNTSMLQLKEMVLNMIECTDLGSDDANFSFCVKQIKRFDSLKKSNRKLRLIQQTFHSSELDDDSIMSPARRLSDSSSKRYSVDVDSFTNDVHYREQAIKTLVQSGDATQLEKAVILAAEHDMDTWPIYVEFLRGVLAFDKDDTRIKTYEEIQTSLTPKFEEETLKVDPLRFGEVLCSDEFFGSIAGTSLGALEYVCRTLVDCCKQIKQQHGKKAQQILKNQSEVKRVAQHIQFLRKLHDMDIDYKLLSGISCFQDLFRPSKIKSKAEIERYFAQMVTKENAKEWSFIMLKLHPSLFSRDNLLLIVLDKEMGLFLDAGVNESSAKTQLMKFLQVLINKLSIEAALRYIVGMLNGEGRDAQTNHYDALTCISHREIRSLILSCIQSHSAELQKLATSDEDGCNFLESYRILYYYCMFIEVVGSIDTDIKRWLVQVGTIGLFPLDWLTNAENVPQALQKAQEKLKKGLALRVSDMHVDEMHFSYENNDNVHATVLYLFKAAIKGCMFRQADNLNFHQFCVLVQMVDLMFSQTEIHAVEEFASMMFDCIKCIEEKIRSQSNDDTALTYAQKLLIDGNIDDILYYFEDDVLRLSYLLLGAFQDVLPNTGWSSGYACKGDYSTELNLPFEVSPDTVRMAVFEQMISKFSVRFEETRFTCHLARYLLFDQLVQQKGFYLSEFQLNFDQYVLCANFAIVAGALYPGVRVQQGDEVDLKGAMSTYCSKVVSSSLTSLQCHGIAWILKNILMLEQNESLQVIWEKKCFQTIVNRLTLEEKHIEQETDSISSNIELSAPCSAILKRLISLGEIENVLRYGRTIGASVLETSDWNSLYNELPDSMLKEKILLGLVFHSACTNDLSFTAYDSWDATPLDFQIQELLFLRFPFSRIFDEKPWLIHSLIKRTKGDNHFPFFTSTYHYWLNQLILLKQYPFAIRLLCTATRFHSSLVNVQHGLALLCSYYRNYEEQLKNDPQRLNASYLGWSDSPTLIHSAKNIIDHVFNEASMP